MTTSLSRLNPLGRGLQLLLLYKPCTNTSIAQSNFLLCRRSVTTRESGAILDEPRREAKYALVKVIATVFAGLGVGAWVSQKFAAFLEENELFVPDDDDDDDD